ncbi:methyl-accepting chemotaxis protein [Hoeflea sp. TYP-13]|uniref:methyl-accepting chemotaxis protein n=1 Tax=Hoeflea sp. TYP-13 TaxID=3230023 RepID=UPI0034C6084E
MDETMSIEPTAAQASSRRFGVAARLISGLSVITILCGLVGVLGLYYISKIEGTLNEITDKAAPTVELADDLIANIWEATKVAEEIIADEEIEDVQQLAKEFAEQDAAFVQIHGELAAIVTDKKLTARLQAVATEHEQFVQYSQQMFAFHLSELQEEAKGKELLAAFDEIGATLITALEEFAIENEAEMARAEEKGDSLQASGASGAAVNKILGELFDQDYPVVEAALKLERLTMEMQDTAGEYFAEESIENLGKIQSNFMDLFAETSSHIAILKNLAETQEDTQDAANIEVMFSSWVASANDDEKLFDTHRDMLEAESQADDMAEVLEDEADSIAATLDAIAEQADAINDSADEQAAATTSNANMIVAIAVGLALLAAVALIITILRTVMRPIKAMTETMAALASGDNTVEVPALERSDEIGDMANAVLVFKENALENERLEAEQKVAEEKAEQAQREAAKEAEARQMQYVVDAFADGLTRLSEGDLTVSLDQPLMEGLDQLRTDFNASIAKLNETLCEIWDNTGSIDNNSREIRTAADDLSRRTEQQAAALEESSAALEEITSAVKGTSERASEAAQMTNAAQTDAEKSSEVVAEAISAMEGIESASSEISNIINVIDEIAFQTNLLALNAGVEAARAGEAGKGFAVVAQEVRELAQRAAHAAKEIKDLITKSGDEVNNGVKLVKATGDALGQISEHVTNVNYAITAIATAANEQLTGVQEVNAAVTQMDQVTQQNAAMVEETTAVTHQLAEDVSGLSRLVGEFKLSNTEPAPIKEADQTSESVPSPARRIVKAVTQAFGFDGNAAKSEQEQSWEDF